MIKCYVTLENDDIMKLEISGHAGYADSGNDIVCSAVSMLSYAIANKILNLDFETAVEVLDNKFVFKNDVASHDLNLLLETLYEGLLMVEDQYGDYISIKEV